MNKLHVILGIDTSNYTTSLSMINLSGEIVFDERKVLTVNKGMVGLQQSEALFQHIKTLPLISKNFSQIFSPYEIVAVSSSVKPRPIEGSYMPVFMLGESFGSTISALLNVPFYEFSHQEGHIEAGLWSLGLQLNKPFLALHISGGTTEALYVIPDDIGYKIEIIGGTSDISVGQYIDRIGVSLGLPFPAGIHMERLLDGKFSNDIGIPISIKDTFVSFSGPETYVQRILKKEDIESIDIIYSVFLSVAKSLYKLVKNILGKYNFKDLLIVGGVASNKIIRDYLQNRLSNEDLNIYFGVPRYCSDNAVGIANLGLKTHLKELKEKN